MLKYAYFVNILFAVLLMSCAGSKPVLMKVNDQSFNTYSKKLRKDLELSYIDEGMKAARPLMFIHGLGSNKSAWAKNIEGLKGQYRCIAVDLPGYGASSKGDFDYNMSFFSEAVVKLTKKLKLKNPVLVGHSMGGQIVLKTLINHSDKYQSAILLAPAGIETFTEKEASWLKMIYTPAVVKSSTDEQIRSNLALNFVAMPDNAEFMIKERIAMKSDPSFGAYSEMIPKCVAGMLDEPVYEQMSQINSKILFLFGAGDQLIPNQLLHKNLSSSSVAVDAASQIPGSELEIWENCGHMLQWECADRTNKAIMTFLSKHK